MKGRGQKTSDGMALVVKLAIREDEAREASQGDERERVIFAGGVRKLNSHKGGGNLRPLQKGGRS